MCVLCLAADRVRFYPWNFPFKSAHSYDAPEHPPYTRIQVIKSNTRLAMLPHSSPSRPKNNEPAQYLQMVLTTRVIDPNELYGGLFSSHGRYTRWHDRITGVEAESADHGVDLRPVQNFFFEQLRRNFM